MYGLTIEIKGDATKALGDVADKLNSEALKAAAGGGVKRLLQDHFGNLDSSRSNALGGKRTHYFASAARSISYETDLYGTTVSIHHLGIGLHYFGGTVKPINTKYLTIPARAEAHGRRAGEFDNLEILWGRSGPVALVERRSQAINFKKVRRKGESKWEMKSVDVVEKGGGVFFWLVKSATIKADPGILPSDSLMVSAAVSSVADYMNRKHGNTI